MATQASTRRSKRVPVRFPAIVHAGANQYRGVCVNVSTGGLAVELDPLPAVGDLLGIEVHLEDGARIVAQGEVRHAGKRTPREAGVRFNSLEPASLIAIHSLVGRYGT